MNGSSEIRSVERKRHSAPGSAVVTRRGTLTGVTEWAQHVLGPVPAMLTLASRAGIPPAVVSQFNWWDWSRPSVWVMTVTYVAFTGMVGIARGDALEMVDGFEHWRRKRPSERDADRIETCGGRTAPPNAVSSTTADSHSSAL